MVTIRFFFPRIWPVLFIFTVAIPAQVTVLPTWNIAQVTKLNQLLLLLSHSKLYFTNRHHHFINAYLVMINACLIFSNSSYYTQYKSKGFFFCPLWSHLLPIFPTTLNSLSFCQLLFHYKGITKQAKTCYLRAFEFALSSSWDTQAPPTLSHFVPFIIEDSVCYRNLLWQLVPLVNIYPITWLY